MGRGDNRVQRQGVQIVQYSERIKCKEREEADKESEGRMGQSTADRMPS